MFTIKLAELQRDITLATQEYKRKVAEFNGDWEADWEDKGTKIILIYDYLDNEIDISWCQQAYEVEKDGYYFSEDVRDSDKQLSELKKLYKKIIKLTEEYRLEEKKWREIK